MHSNVIHSSKAHLASMEEKEWHVKRRVETVETVGTLTNPTERERDALTVICREACCPDCHWWFCFVQHLQKQNQDPQSGYARLHINKTESELGQKIRNLYKLASPKSTACALWERCWFTRRLRPFEWVWLAQKLVMLMICSLDWQSWSVFAANLHEILKLMN